MVDHDGAGLAGVSRELAFLDAQGGRPRGYAGRPGGPQRAPETAAAGAVDDQQRAKIASMFANSRWRDACCASKSASGMSAIWNIVKL